MYHRTFALILLITNSLNLISQEVGNGEIEVIGYSQKEVTPDEIYYEIVISDYKEGREFIQLDEIERMFWKMIAELEISKDRIEIDDTDSRRIEYRRRKTEIKRSKTYWIKFKEISELDEFASRIEKLEIEKSGIVRVDYSKMEELEEELKVEAIRNAKSRAEKILSSIGEELGKVKQITEMFQNDYQSYILEQYLNFSNLTMKVERGMYSGNSNGVKYKKVKFKTTIKAIFEIK